MYFSFTKMADLARAFGLSDRSVWINRLVVVIQQAGHPSSPSIEPGEHVQIELLDNTIGCSPSLFDARLDLDGDRLVESRCVGLRINVDGQHWTMTPHHDDTEHWWIVEPDDVHAYEWAKVHAGFLDSDSAERRAWDAAYREYEEGDQGYAMDWELERQAKAMRGA